MKFCRRLLCSAIDRGKHSFYETAAVHQQYTNQSLSIKPIHLAELLRWGERPVTEQKLIESAEFVRTELPKRLAKRVLAIQQLPFIVGLNPHIRSVYLLYQDSYYKIQEYPRIETIEQEKEFTEIISDSVDSHSQVIPSLARGILECKKYLTPEQITDFLNKTIRARIGIRVIAEHHLALHETREGYTGILNHSLSPKKILDKCIPHAQELCELNFGAYPNAIINGDVETTFPFIDVHLEYMLFELLKNAFRASVQFASKQFSLHIPSVEITIAKGEKDVGIRIRDQGGGFSHERTRQMWMYSFSTVDEEQEEEEGRGVLSAATKLAVVHGTGGPIAGLGYGLPMTRIYAQWSGGSLDLVPMENYGCDVFLRLPHIGNVSI